MEILAIAILVIFFALVYGFGYTRASNEWRSIYHASMAEEEGFMSDEELAELLSKGGS
jgi:hypothetical protein